VISYIKKIVSIVGLMIGDTTDPDPTIGISNSVWLHRENAR